MRKGMQAAVALATAWAFSGLTLSASAADTANTSKDTASTKSAVTRNYSGNTQNSKSQVQKASPDKSEVTGHVTPAPAKKKHTSAKHSSSKKHSGAKAKHSESDAPAVAPEKEKK